MDILALYGYPRTHVDILARSVDNLARMRGYPLFQAYEDIHVRARISTMCARISTMDILAHPRTRCGYPRTQWIASHAVDILVRNYG